MFLHLRICLLNFALPVCDMPEILKMRFKKKEKKHAQNNNVPNQTGRVLLLLVCADRYVNVRKSKSYPLRKYKGEV